MSETFNSGEKSGQNGITDTNRLLITGANGFIGRALISCLRNEKHQIIALVSSSKSKQELIQYLAQLNNSQADPDSNRHPERPSQNITVVVADITDLAELKRELNTLGDEACSVVHLAGLAHVGRDEEDNYHRVNTEGSLNLLKVLEAKVVRFIYLSSSLASAAEAKAEVSTSYGESKLAAENRLRSAAETAGIQLGILRPCNIYGTGMKGNLRTLIRLIRRRILPPLPNYRNRLSLVSDKDVVAAIQLQLKTKVLLSKPYYLTDGKTYSTKEIETAIYKALQLKIPKWQTPNVIIYLSIWTLGLLGHLPGVRHSISRRTYENLVSDNFYSNEEAQKDLGFRPSTDFYNELQSIVEVV